MPDILQAVGERDSARVIREMRVRSLFWPYYFEKVVLGLEDLKPEFHGIELEEFVTRLLEGQNKQWIEWARGHFKTSCFTVGLSIWFVLPNDAEDEAFAVKELGIPVEKWRERMKLHNRNLTQLLAFENIGNAQLKIEEIKQHFEKNEWFRACFPEISYAGTEKPWSADGLRIRRDPGVVIGEPSFTAIGVDGALQSRHYDVIWADDIVGKSATESPTVMASTIRWFGLLNGAGRGKILKDEWRLFGVSNRWGYYDLNSVLRDGGQFHFHTRSAIENDRLVLLSEKRWQEILKDPALSKYDRSCQYLNDPIPPGENEIQSGSVHIYAVGEGGQIECSCGAKFMPSQLRRFAHYDPYQARGVRSTSSPAIVVVGCSADKHVFLLDYFTVKGDYDKIFNEIFRMNDEWWPELWTYEDVASQNMVEFYIREAQKTDEFKKVHRRFRRIMPAPTGGRAKEVRIRDTFLPFIENGKFACRRKHHLFFQMLETWPHAVPGHDYDLLDALAQGPQHWRFPELEDDHKSSTREEQELLKQLGKPYGWTTQAHMVQ